MVSVSCKQSHLVSNRIACRLITQSLILLLFFHFPIFYFSMSAIHLNSSNFDSTLTSSQVPVLVDFYADWCGPCKMLSPVIEQVAIEREGKAVVAKLNVDEAQEIAARYRITSIPALIVFKNGEAVATGRGVMSKAAVESLIDQAS